MRRRERLTGFLIIFILLTFSAYSNSMNVGGRIGLPNNISNGQREVSSTKTSARDLNSRKIEQKDINNKNLEKNISGNNDRSQNQNKDNTTLKNSQTNNTAADAGRDINIKRENDEIKDAERNRDGNSEIKKEETTFGKRYEPQLIDQVKVHKVRSGETLWDIAHKHDLNIDSLIGANNISNMNSIKPGQEFKILPVKGIIYRVSPGESVGSIARKFEIKEETIMKDNNIEDASGLKIDQKLILRGAKPEFSYQDRLDQKFMYPINTRITSYYGPRWGRIHEGLDFAAPMGSPIRAVSSGRVVYSGWATGYGYVVIVEHQKGLRTLYAHNSKLLVSVGESVGKGEVISRSGNTGNSTGPHLHFEVQVNGRPENPLNYINR